MCLNQCKPINQWFMLYKEKYNYLSVKGSRYIFYHIIIARNISNNYSLKTFWNNRDIFNVFEGTSYFCTFVLSRSDVDKKLWEMILKFYCVTYCTCSGNLHYHQDWAYERNKSEEMPNKFSYKHQYFSIK